LYLHEKITKGICIIIVYVNDIDIVRSPNKLTKAKKFDCLKKEFEMKVFGRTKFCLGL